MPLVPFPTLPTPGVELTIDLTCSQLTPPSVLLRWDPPDPALGAAFVAYNVYRRPARMPVAAFVKIGRITVPVGGVPATIEQEHTAFIDDEAYWHRDENGHWEGGWDYVFTVENDIGVESFFTEPSLGNRVPAAANAWETCNAARWLNSPLQVVPAAASDSNSRQVIREYTGRDLSVVRTPSELPGRNLQAAGLFMAAVGPDQLRSLRAAEASGRQVSLIRQNGDVVVGTIALPKWKDADGGVQFQDVTIQMTETSRYVPVLADYNVACQMPFNGSSQYVRTVHDDALVVPSSAAGFSGMIAARFPTGIPAIHLAKNLDGSGSTQQWFLGNSSAGVVTLYVQGIQNVSLTLPTDGDVHVISFSAADSAQQIYLDGHLMETRTDTGMDQTTNTHDLIAGAGNDATFAFSAMDYQAHAFWPKGLTPDEHAAGAHYLLGHPGFRMPPAAGAFYDARDDRCLARLAGSLLGFPLHDLSGNDLTAYVLGTPPTRGYPWPLRDIERF